MAIKKISKPGIIAIVIIVVLSVAFAVFLPLYLKKNQPQRDLYLNSQIKIVAYGEEVGVYTLSQLLEIEGVEAEDFQAIYDTSTSEPVEKAYTGIELKVVLLALGVNLGNARMITFKASDGMNKVYTQQDVVKNNNVYIAYKVNGREFNTGIDPLAYTKENEDGGPFVLIKVEDSYSQNRCKLLVEISVS